MPKQNAAGRLVAVLERARQATNNNPAADVWATLLGTQGLAQPARDQETARLLGVLLTQVTSLRDELHARGVPGAVYTTRLQLVERLLGVRVFGHGWDGHVRAQIGDGTVEALRMCAGLLGDAEEALLPDSLADVQATVTGLRATVEGSALPSPVREFLLRQVALMERGLREYPLRGAAAFRGASDDAAAEWVRDAPVVVPHRDAPEVREVAGFWAKLERLNTRVVLIGTLWATLAGGAWAALRAADHAGVLPAGVSEALGPLLYLKLDEPPRVRGLLPPGEPAEERPTPAAPDAVQGAPPAPAAV